ncbi:hypothetical protein E4T47_04759 [Aureobasidium subglaciale]|nr:hypothetical protein E4T47_04759 [Aureobasidium subglaciale]
MRHLYHGKTSTMATSTLGSLARLPVELRLHIYELVLADPTNYDIKNYPDRKIIKQRQCALLSTSHQIRLETLFAALPGAKLCAQISIKQSDKSARWDPVLIPGHTADSTPFNTRNFGHNTMLWNGLLEAERKHFMTNLETAVLSMVFDPLFLEIGITIGSSEEAAGNVRVQFRDARRSNSRKTGEIAPPVAPDDHLRSIMADLGPKVVAILSRPGKDYGSLTINSIFKILNEMQLYGWRRVDPPRKERYFGLQGKEAGRSDHDWYCGLLPKLFELVSQHKDLDHCGKPLSPRFVEVLCVGCRDEPQPLLQRAKETGGSSGRKRKIIAQITKERFEAFKERYGHGGRTVNHFWNFERELWKELAKKQRDAMDLDD